MPKQISERDFCGDPRRCGCPADRCKRLIHCARSTEKVAAEASVPAVRPCKQIWVETGGKPSIHKNRNFLPWSFTGDSECSAPKRWSTSTNIKDVSLLEDRL